VGGGAISKFALPSSCLQRNFLLGRVFCAKRVLLV